jgi:CRP-like cAMP-binding protein
MLTNPVQRLASLDLFAGCAARTLRRIDTLSCTVDVRPGRVLCREGEIGEEFFVLLAGLVEVRRGNGSVALLHPGAWFGETALLTKERRHATVTTTTAATVLVFGKREFHALLALSSDVQTRLQETSRRVNRGCTPTRLPWYEPLPRQPKIAFEAS